MIEIDIRTNFPGVAEALRSAERGLAEKALARALNRTVEQGRTQMVRQIAAEFSVSSSTVRARLVIRPARATAGRVRLEASLAAPEKAGRRSINVIAFAERAVTLAEARRRAKAGTLSQLRFRIKRGGGWKTIPGAFIGNRGRTVFRRTGKARLPIEAVSTIDIPQMFNARRINEAVRAVMLSRFPDVFARELRFALGRLAS